jgi:peroxiredoxin
VALAQLGRFNALEPLIADFEQRLQTLTAEQTKAGEAAAEQVKKEAAGKPPAPSASASNATTVPADKPVDEAEEKRLASKEEDKDDSKDDSKDGNKDGNKDSDKTSDKKKADKPQKSTAEKASDTARRAFDKRLDVVKEALAEWRAAVAIHEGNTSEAEKQLVSAKGTDKWRLALYYLANGNEEDAEKIAKEAVENKKEVKFTQPLAVLAYIQQQRQNLDEAEKTFTSLRALSAHIELTAPPFARLASLAEALGFPTDWRMPYVLPDDVGVRPPLAELGPFRWQPSPAWSWTLSDEEGKPHQLADYSGRPVVIIFYLGYGCVHCTEQLAAFWPMAQAYKEAGISLIGISTDSVANLHKALEPAKATSGFPFPLVADPSLSIFKTYRVYDDFEKQPLHGTFLIDANGLVRWQDISFQPFMDASFLLKEAQRLLALPSPN